MGKDKSYVFRLTRDQHKRIRKEAFEKEISMAELIRRSVEYYLEKEEYKIEEGKDE